MSALTIRLPDNIFSEVKTRAKELHISRSEYIRKAIEVMNASLKEKDKKARLIAASKRVRENSMEINAEFEKVRYDFES